MKKIVPIILVIIVIVAAVIFCPKLMHTCDDCGKFFIGTGYEPNIIEDMLASEDMIICKDCAQEQHALSSLVGQSLDEYKIDLF